MISEKSVSSFHFELKIDNISFLLKLPNVLFTFRLTNLFVSLHKIHNKIHSVSSFANFNLNRLINEKSAIIAKSVADEEPHFSSTIDIDEHLNINIDSNISTLMIFVHFFAIKDIKIDPSFFDTVFSFAQTFISLASSISIGTLKIKYINEPMTLQLGLTKDKTVKYTFDLVSLELQDFINVILNNANLVLNHKTDFTITQNVNFVFQVNKTGASFDSKAIAFHIPWDEIAEFIPSKESIIKIYETILKLLKLFRVSSVKIPTYQALFGLPIFDIYLNSESEIHCQIKNSVASIQTNPLYMLTTTEEISIDDLLTVSNSQIEISKDNPPVLRSSSVTVKTSQLLQKLPHNFFEKIPIYILPLENSLTLGQLQIESQKDSVDFKIQANEIAGQTKNQIIGIDLQLENLEVDKTQIFQKLPVHLDITTPKDLEIISSFTLPEGSNSLPILVSFLEKIFKVEVKKEADKTQLILIKEIPSNPK